MRGLRVLGSLLAYVRSTVALLSSVVTSTEESRADRCVIHAGCTETDSNAGYILLGRFGVFD